MWLMQVSVCCQWQISMWCVMFIMLISSFECGVGLDIFSEVRQDSVNHVKQQKEK